MCSPLKALDVLDAQTRKKIEAANGVEEINQILGSSTVQWQTHARCLRHPMAPGGCKPPSGTDIEPRPIYGWMYCPVQVEVNLSYTGWIFSTVLYCTTVSANFPQTEDHCGVSCKDDSRGGNMKQNFGEGRKAALTHWRWPDGNRAGGIFNCPVCQPMLC